MKKMLVSTALFSAIASTSLNAAAVDKAALLDKIRAQSSQYSEFKVLLTSPDQSVRFAAFDTMYNSGDKILKELAVDEALAYPDATLQSLAFKEIILGLDTLSFQLSAPDDADEKTLKRIIGWGYSLSYKLNQKDPKTGHITRCGNSSNCTGQVSGLQLTLSDGCHLTATLTEGVQLKGTVRCRDIMPVNVVSNLK